MSITRRVFYSFKFDEDFWRVQQLRQIGKLEGNSPVSANAWEEVKRGKGPAIERWIKSTMEGKKCLVCFAGEKTWTSDWVKYELKYAWEQGKGVVAVRIHKLLDQFGRSASEGVNPMELVTVSANRLESLPQTTSRSLSSVANIHSPTGSDSKAVYASISINLETWIEDAIANRAKYRQ